MILIIGWRKNSVMVLGYSITAGLVTIKQYGIHKLIWNPAQKQIEESGMLLQRNIIIMFLLPTTTIIGDTIIL